MAAYKNRPFYGQAAPALRPQYESDVRVIRHEQAETVAQPSLLPTLAKMLAIIIVTIALLGCARIVLTSHTVLTMIESDAIQAQITEARSNGIALEMEQSVLKNPSAIRAQARQMDMHTPYYVSTITLTPDVVVIENGDTLSLSGTIKNVVSVKQ